MKLPRNHIPLYYQIEQILREQISSGDISRDEPLPTETQLCEEYGVSRSTVRQAFASLINDGLVSRVPGKGTYLSQGNSEEKTFHFFTDIEDLVGLAEKANNKVTYHGQVVPAKKIALLLSLGPGQKTLRICGIRFLRNLPLCYFIIHVPSEFAHFFNGEDLKSGAILTILENKSGMVARKVRQTISATKADKRAARFLGIAPGDPVLQFERVHYLINDRPIEVGISYFHPKRYSYVVEFKHKQRGGNANGSTHGKTAETIGGGQKKGLRKW